MVRLHDWLARRPGITACAAYGAWALALTWPLPVRLGSAFLGPVSGDLGVYAWNLWIFGHEALEHGRLPFSTDHVFAYTQGADFSLHNYTPLAGLLAAPLLPYFGLVATFNLLLLLALVSAGWAVFRLAHRAGLAPLPAGIAGGLFMATPVLSARSTAHVSLVAVAAVPLFLVAVLNVLDRPRRRTALAIGAAVAAATYCDAYFGVYCVLAGAAIVAARFVRVTTHSRAERRSTATRVLLCGMAVAVLVALVSRSSGVPSIDVGPLHVALGHAHNPLLIAVGLALAAAWSAWRPQIHVADSCHQLPVLSRLAGLSVAVATLLLAPMLIGVFNRYLHGRLPDVQVLWRSSPRGVDLLGYLVPNPVHPWLGQITGGWFMPPVEDAFPEFVAAFPLGAWALIALAWRKGRLPRLWTGFSALFLALSLGPFIHIAGVNTEVIGPWALLRYLPVIGLARSPSRFAIVAAIGLSILTASALQHLWHDARRRRRLAGGLVVVIALEVWPVARPLYSPAVPDVYRVIAAADHEDGALLDLPTGIRDGASSVGDFRASTQYFQATHHRPLVGGYLSRVSEWRKQESRRAPVLRALFALSEPDGTITTAQWDAARASRDRFLARSCVRYVVIDRQRASADLRAFAIDALDLQLLWQDRERELFTPADPPPCETPRRPLRWTRVRPARDVAPPPPLPLSTR